MARITDPERIERIKKSTMALIVANGYMGVTISNIAQNADVSAGYLYRHFESKEALINALINETFSSLKNNISQQLESQATVRDIVAFHFKTFLSIANDKPIDARFICALTNDARFTGSDVLEINPLAKKTLEKGIATGEIRPEVTVETLRLFLVSLPTSFMARKLHQSDFKGITTEEITLLTDMCLRALS